MQQTSSDGTSWFKGWFGSPYYKLLYSNRDVDEARLFIANITRHLGLKEGDRVLDLACGRGRHSIELHRLGFDVVGIDISEESISEASAAQHTGIRFLVHDMRQPFPVRDLDAVLNLFTSFGYFHSSEDDLLTIKAVMDALKPGGFFVIDFLNSVRTLKEMVAEDTVERDGIRFNIQRRLVDNIITKEITVIDGSEQHFFQEEVDALSFDDFEGYFNHSGFSVIEVFGDYDLKAFDPEISERLIMVAMKPTA
jgi:SAM-dependent methyltransferase